MQSYGRWLVILGIWAAFWLTGCAYFEEPFPQLVETQPQLVSQCDMLAVIAETANADRVFSYGATREMINTLKQRAVQLGATHIVWLHQTSSAATAEAYRCGVQ